MKFTSLSGSVITPEPISHNVPTKEKVNSHSSTLSKNTRESKMHIRLATVDDAYQLAPNLRATDKAEASVVSGKTPLEVLLLGITKSPAAYSILLNNQIVGMFGATPSQIDGLGIPWLLVSDEFFHLPLRTKTLEASKWLTVLSQNFNTLQNYISIDNHKAIRWLKWLGFHFTRKIENYGIGHTTYWEFQMKFS